MAQFFHMSPGIYPVGHKIRGNGSDKVDPRIEDELEKRKPDGALSRRDAVFCLDHTDFAVCGVVSPGYVYRVKPSSEPQRRDFAWIGEMQKAHLKIKYPTTLWFRTYPNWNTDLIEKCCFAYWSGIATESPGWEFVTQSCTVSELLANELVDPKKTKGGWRPWGQTSS